MYVVLGKALAHYFGCETFVEACILGWCGLAFMQYQNT
jgi:hypothetical protein